MSSDFDAEIIELFSSLREGEDLEDDGTTPEEQFIWLLVDWLSDALRGVATPMQERLLTLGPYVLSGDPGDLALVDKRRP